MRKREAVLNKLKSDVVEYADYIIENGATIRATAEHFGNMNFSKLSRHINTLLPEVDSEKYKQVQDILQKNKKERHIRGGISTQNKFMRSSAC